MVLWIVSVAIAIIALMLLVSAAILGTDDDYAPIFWGAVIAIIFVALLATGIHHNLIVNHF